MRHCQQFFWILAYTYQHKADFKTSSGKAFERMGKTWTDLTKEEPEAKVHALISTITVPNEPIVHIALQRLAISWYYRDLHFNIEFWKKTPANLTQQWFKDYQDDLTLCKEIADDILKTAGPGGRPVDVTQILKELGEDDASYRRRPWEEDAYFTGDLVDAYWIPRFYTPLRPDEWTSGYPDKPV